MKITEESKTQFIHQECFWFGQKTEDRFYERLADGSQGKLVRQIFYDQDGDVSALQENKTMSWREFCKQYKDCPKYKSSPSL